MDNHSNLDLDLALDETSVHCTQTWQIPLHLHGNRLDQAISAHLTLFSRSYLQQLIAQNCVLINDRKVIKNSHKVNYNDTISIKIIPPLQQQSFQPEDIKLSIVYEDAEILVINKPVGLVVHPAPGNWRGTLMNALLHHFLQTQSDEASTLPRAGIVHRLDKDTSGLMVIAKTRIIMDTLVEMIAQRLINRQYLAITPTLVKSTTFTIDAPIGRDPRNRLRMAIANLSYQAGKTARTDFIVKAQSTKGSLLQCTLHTGRTHQIRVHSAYHGAPLLGDILYGGQPHPLLSGQALHAFRLTFGHPKTHQPLEFVVQPPPAMQAICTQWQLGL